MAAVHFPSNALRSKIFKKASGCLLKDRPKAGGRFVYSVKISHHYVILCHLYSVIFNWHWQCTYGKCICRHLFRERGLHHVYHFI